MIISIISIGIPANVGFAGIKAIMKHKNSEINLSLESNRWYWWLSLVTIRQRDNLWIGKVISGWKLEGGT